MRIYGSIDEALLAFDRYVQIEPRLGQLWDLCRQAAPPARGSESTDDVYDSDPFESDPLAAVNPDDGWCAEDWFRDHVKSRLLLLTGLYRSGPPHELHTREAFEEIYGLLLDWALHRPCSCCSKPDPGDRLGDAVHT